MNAQEDRTASMARTPSEAHTLFTEILESVPQAILAVSHEGCILACNRNAEFIFRIQRAEVIDRKYEEALPPALAQAMSRLIHSASKSGDSLDSEFDFLVERRTKLPLGISLSPILDREDRPRGFVFVVRDMSLRHEAQNLRQLHQMNLEFVHTVSHEIKAPLTTIQLGTAELLSQRTPLAEECLTTLQLIDDAARRIQGLVNDFLDVAKLEGGHAALETELGDLGLLAKKMMDGFHHVQKANIELEIDRALPPVKFDSKRIHRALENLVINAIKYSRPPARIRVSVTREGDCVKVAVADQGIGIPQEQLGLVWEKFYRALAPETTNVAGSGLGLTIVKHIVSMHGGEVDATSEVGKGSVFSFTLPLRRT